MQLLCLSSHLSLFPSLSFFEIQRRFKMVLIQMVSFFTFVVYVYLTFSFLSFRKT